MSVLAAEIVDVGALVHVAIYSLVGGLGLVLAYGTLTLAYDRMESAPRRGAWPAVLGASALVCLAIVAVGVWAMTQKS